MLGMWEARRTGLYRRDQEWEWGSAGGRGERHTREHAVHPQALARAHHSCTHSPTFQVRWRGREVGVGGQVRGQVGGITA